MSQLIHISRLTAAAPLLGLLLALLLRPARS
jgi:hypothetical protein